MNTQRKVIQLISVALLLLWGGVMLYFYTSGRLLKGDYVSREGWFTTMVLIGGLGCVVVGLFNLATLGKTEAGSPDDGPGGDVDPRGAGRHHGLLEEHGWVGRLVGASVLAVPICYASIHSPDGFKNLKTLENKGTYAQTYQKDANAGKFDLKKADAAKTTPAAKTTSAIASSPPAAPSVASVSPMPVVSTPPGPAPAAAATDGTTAVTSTTPPSGASQTKSNGTFTLEDLKAQVERSPEGNFKLEVPEIYYTAGDKEVQAVLTGQPVETIAQVIPEKVNNAKGTRVRIFRMLIQCCAADARPYSIPVEFGKKPPVIKDMTWVKVVGKMDFHSEGTQIVPVIMATSMTAVPEPENKMVY